MSSWNCYFCNCSTSWAGKNKHLFSKQHSLELIRAILVSRSLWVSWLKQIEAGKQLVQPPSIKIKDKAYHICFGCKTLVQVVPSALYHPCSCKLKDAHIQKIKDILALKSDVVGEINEQLTIIDAPRQLEKHKKEINTLKIERTIDKEDLKEAITALKNIMIEFPDVKKFLDLNHPELYASLDE